MTRPRARLWSPLAALNAAKTTLGIVVAWGIVLWQQLPDPYLAPIAVLFLQTPYLGASLRKGLLRVLGTLAGALVALAVLGMLVQDRWALVATLSVVMAIAVYMIRSSAYGYAWFMLAITVSIVAGEAAIEPDWAFAKAVARTTEAIVGILVVLAINGLLWPRTGGALYDATYGAALTGLAEQMRRLGEAVADPTATSLPQASRRLRDAPLQLREILDAAVLDSGGFRRLQPTYDAQVRGLAGVIGALMAFGENLRLAAEGERAFLRPADRGLLGAALVDLAGTLERIGRRSDRDRRAGNGRPAQLVAGLAAARGRLARLDDDLRQGAQGAAEVAILQAAVFALRGLIARVEGLSDAADAVAAGRPLPASALPAAPNPPLIERLGRGLPNALLAAAAFWVMALLWIGLQWPPSGVVGITMAVVVIGVETLGGIPVQNRGARLTLGVAAGAVVTAPIYFLAMPRLNGFFELALLLFPFYFAIGYFFHALPAPRNVFFLGLGLMAILMVQLQPVQSFDPASYSASALSILTGFSVGLGLLGLFQARSPQERLRRALKDLLAALEQSFEALADRKRVDFERVSAEQERRLRTALHAFTDIAPLADTADVPANDRARIDALVDAVETLLIRVGALQQARARWDRECSSDPGLDCPRTGFGRGWRLAFQSTLQSFMKRLDAPGGTIPLDALDANRSRALAELEEIQARHGAAPGSEGAAYVLAIAGHYIGVARALRILAEVIGTIDWAAWRVPRFF